MVRTHFSWGWLNHAFKQPDPDDEITDYDFRRQSGHPVRSCYLPDPQTIQQLSMDVDIPVSVSDSLADLSYSDESLPRQ